MAPTNRSKSSQSSRRRASSLTGVLRSRSSRRSPSPVTTVSDVASIPVPLLDFIIENSRYVIDKTRSKRNLLIDFVCDQSKANFNDCNKANIRHFLKQESTADQTNRLRLYLDPIFASFLYIPDTPFCKDGNPDNHPIHVIIPENASNSKGYLLMPNAELGKGGEGRVIKAYDIFSDSIVACKIIEHDRFANDSERINRERRNLKMVNNQFQGQLSCVIGDTIIDYTFMSFYNGSNLRNKLYAMIPGEDEQDLVVKKLRQPFLDTIKICVGIIEELLLIHESGLVYRDLKTENFILEQTLDRIAIHAVDFGSSLTIEETARIKSLDGTSPGYRAPELSYSSSKRPQYGTQQDYFSLGIVLAEVLSVYNFQLGLQSLLKHKQHASQEITANEIMSLMPDIFPEYTDKDLKFTIKPGSDLEYGPDDASVTSDYDEAYESAYLAAKQILIELIQKLTRMPNTSDFPEDYIRIHDSELKQYLVRIQSVLDSQCSVAHTRIGAQTHSTSNSSKSSKNRHSYDGSHSRRRSQSPTHRKINELSSYRMSSSLPELPSANGLYLEASNPIHLTEIQASETDSRSSPKSANIKEMIGELSSLSLTDDESSIGSTLSPSITPSLNNERSRSKQEDNQTSKSYPMTRKSKP